MGNICYTCDGTGVLTCNRCQGSGIATCPKCKGSGFVNYNSGFGSSSPAFGYPSKKIGSARVNSGIRMSSGSGYCNKCAGTGQVFCLKCSQTGRVRCLKCDGTGEYPPPSQMRSRFTPPLFSEQREKGTVKWFSKTKGFGFIIADVDGAEVFVSKKTLQGTEELSQGERVEFVRKPGDKGPWAATIVKDEI